MVSYIRFFSVDARFAELTLPSRAPVEIVETAGELLEDPRESRADAVAQSLGLRFVLSLVCFNSFVVVPCLFPFIRCFSSLFPLIR